MGTKLAWGVLSGARIGLNTVVPAIQASDNGRVVALASRRPEAVKERAEALGVARIYDSYEALLDDPEVTAIYNPLPNGLHGEWTIRAVERGKHVLCEKPFALNTAEAERMVEAGRRAGVRVMEAFMYRFHPQHARAHALIAEGALGPVRFVRVAFSFRLDPAQKGNVRFVPELGGGALMDVGCYCISSSRWYLGGEPTAVLATARLSDELGVDMTVAALMEFPDGRLAQFVCSFEMTGQPHVEIVGERGRLEIPRAFTPGAGEARMRLTRGGEFEEIVVPGEDQYRLQVEHFAAAVLDGRPLALPPEDAIANTRVLDAVRRSAADGRRVTLGG